MHRIKLEAKRNRRQRKKLQVGEYQLLVVRISFRHCYTPDSEDLSSLVDGCYVIADKYNCDMYTYTEDDCMVFVVNNNLYARDFTNCVVLIENYLIHTELLLNSVRVVVHEAQNREISYFNYIDRVGDKSVTEGVKL